MYCFTKLVAEKKEWKQTTGKIDSFSLKKASGKRLGGQKVTFPKNVQTERNDTSVLGAILVVMGPTISEK